MSSLFDELKEGWTRHSRARGPVNHGEAAMEHLPPDRGWRVIAGDIDEPRALTRWPLPEGPADFLFEVCFFGLRGANTNEAGGRDR